MSPIELLVVEQRQLQSASLTRDQAPVLVRLYRGDVVQLDALRTWLRKRGITSMIPHRWDETSGEDYDREVYSKRPVIERTINRLKPYRRIAKRYEKLAGNYLEMITIARIVVEL